MAEKQTWSGFDLIQLEGSSEARKKISMEELMSQLSEFERSSVKEESEEIKKVEVKEAMLIPIDGLSDHSEEILQPIQTANSKSIRGPSGERDFDTSSDKDITDVQPMEDMFDYSKLKEMVNPIWEPLQLHKNQTENQFPNDGQNSEMYSPMRGRSEERGQPTFHTKSAPQSDFQHERSTPIVQANEKYGRQEEQSPVMTHVENDNPSIRIRGPVMSIGEEMLSLVFENGKRSGGGAINKIEMDVVNGEAILTFEDVLVADRVLSKFENTPCVILNEEIFLDRYIPEEISENRMNRNICDPELLKVSQFSPVTTQEHLHLFFENKKQSGGDDVKEVQLIASDGTCLIEFEDSSVIDQVLERQSQQPLILGGKELLVERYVKPQTSSTGKVRRLLRVIGLPPGTTEEAITFYFEDHRKYGGGYIDNVDYDEETGVARIKYEDETVVGRVLERARYRPIKLGGIELTLDYIDEEIVERSIGEDETLSVISSFSGISSTTSQRADTVLLKVCGLSSSLSNDLIQCYFENARRVGGGDIQNIERNVEAGIALIKFENIKVIDQVLKKSKEKPLVIEGSKLSVEKYYPDIQDERDVDGVYDRKRDIITEDDEHSITEQQLSYLKVSSLIPTMTKDTIEFYFENTRRSGGGAIKNIEWESLNEGYILIEFEEANVIDIVVAKSQKEALKLENQIISVMKYEPPPPKPVDPLKVFLTNLNPNTTEDCLLLFLEAKSNATPVRMEYTADKQSAMVSFSEKPDFELLSKTCAAKQLEGQHLKVERVSISDAVKVSNISQTTTRDTIEYYFENRKRSNGGPVEKVELFSEKGFALVYFEEASAAERVCEAGRKHVIDGCELHVAIYYDCLMSVNNTKSNTSSEQSLSKLKLKVEVDAFFLMYLKRVPKAKRSFETLLKDNAAMLEGWPEENDPTLIVMYDNQSDSKKNTTDWSSAVKAALSTFFSALDLETISTFQEVSKSPEFRTELPKIKAENAAMFVKDNALNIVGEKESVHKVADQVKAMFRKLEEKLKNKKEQSSKTIPLKKFQISLLLSKNFPNQIKKLIPGLEVVVDMNKGNITFTALVEQIEKCEVEMYKVINSYQSKPMPLTERGIKLLLENDVRKLIKKKMDAKNIIGVWQIQHQVEQVTVYSDSDQDVDLAIKIIKETIWEKTIKLVGDAKTYMQSKEWSVIQADLNKFKGKLCYQITGDWNELCIAGTDDLRESAMEKINAFLKNHSKSEKTITIGKGKFRFLKEHKSADLDDLKDRLKAKSTMLYPSNNSEYKIKGPVDGVRDAEHSLTKLVRDIKILQLKFKRVGLSGFFDGVKGRDLIESVEKKEMCVIEYQTQDTSETTTSSASHGTAFAEVALSNGCKIIVSKCDMTQLAIDVIVNAANETLMHGAGLAGAIVSKGGKGIQDESSKIVLKNGKIPVGSMVVTHAGKLPCKRIFHAVGPHWTGGKQGEELALKSAVKKCLHKALAEGYVSIAFPALCSGIFGYPVNKATKDIVVAIQDYFSRTSGSFSLTIFLCDIQLNTVKCFAEALKSIGGSAVTGGQSGASAYAEGGQSSDDDDDDDDDEDDDDDDGGDDDDNADVGSHRDATYTPKRININVTQGNLTDMKVDALVNTVGGDLNLSSGAVSNAILRAAGNAIQQECKLKYPQGLQRGVIAETSGGQMSCQRIFHGTMCNYKQRDACKIMADLVTSCLQMADTYRFTSIAFPALGTGNLGFPANTAASQMFNAVRQYDAKTPRTSLQKVLFVVYHKDKEVLQAFKAEESGRPRPGRSKRGGSRSRASSQTPQRKPKGNSTKKDSVNLCAYSDSIKCITRAKERINACLDEEFKEKTIKKDTIKHLKIDKIRILRRIASSANVKISIVKKKSLIRLAGRSKSVQETTETINDLLQQIQLTYHEASSAKVLSKVAQWYYVESGTENEYTPEVNGLIEKAYQEKKPFHQLKTRSGEVYIVDFKKEIEYKKANPSDSVPVIRKDLTEGDIQLPKTWEPMKKGETIRFVTLSTGSPEYKKISQMFTQSSGNFAATQIDRIQNKSLYYQYIAKKGEIEQECAQGVVVERELWHGTAETSVDSITNKGFNRTLSNNGSIGIGTYFAVNASYSVQGYCPGGSQGRHIFLCKVLTGDTAQGQGGIKLPPAKTGAHIQLSGRGAACHKSYHSVTDRPGAPSMFVIFHDAQAYPMYHIIF